MKSYVVAAVAVACMLTGCSRTVDGVVAQTTEPVSAEGMTCEEFLILGNRDQFAVVEELLPDAEPGRQALAGGLARVLCQTAPQVQVEQLVRGLG